jgi:dienelactone hydrolase
MKTLPLLGIVAAASMLAACGGNSADNLGIVDNTPARGALIQNPPPRTAFFSAGDFAAKLNASASGRNLLAIAGTPKCGVDVQYIRYGTVGGANEGTDASGALMTPSGGPDCTGSRPIVLYAHGTTTVKSYNLANLLDETSAAYSEAALIAATYAAQGFIVVAPNYAGYDASKLAYHPYLNADQSSKEMMDALSAARKALPGLLQPVQDNGKLFITGYSQGGHVAMATHKAMQAAGQAVTASAPMSGPYALAAYTDAIFYGSVPLGSTLFAPLLVNSYQKAYGNIYRNLTDVYEPGYASGIDTLLPTDTPFSTLTAPGGKLPQTALFSRTPPTAPAGSGLQPTLNAISPPAMPPELAPLFALGFGTSNLLNNQFRLDYLLDAFARPDGAVPAVTTGAQAASPAHPVRIATKKNDLRNWTPTRPVLLCAGSGDPTVFYSANTQLMQGFWSSPSPAAPAAGLLTVLNVDSPAGAADPYAAAKAGFAQAKAATALAAVAAGATDGGTSAVVQAYHGGLVPPFCNTAARGFFQQVTASNL